MNPSDDDNDTAGINKFRAQLELDMVAEFTTSFNLRIETYQRHWGGGGQVFSWVGSECTTSSNFGWIVDDTVVGYACKSKLLDDCIELYRNSACTG